MASAAGAKRERAVKEIHAEGGEAGNRFAETNAAALHPARLSRPLRRGYVQCTACEHWCALAPGASGKCGVRRNLAGALRLVVYGRAIAVQIDPIEKKPLHHFLPQSRIFSIGTVGCNLSCAWCQNAQISQFKTFDLPRAHIGQRLSPQQIVAQCLHDRIPAVAFTYNEPAVYWEYAFDTAKLARAAGLRTVFVSSGFETLAALDGIAPYLSAINVDLKAFDDATYRRYCDARLAPVLRNIRHLVEQTSVWTEVTTLVIPGINDGDAELRAIAGFLAGISPDLPWHISAFMPHYRMQDRPPTSAAALRRAWEIGKEAGLRYVYAGNLWAAPQLAGCADTVCPMCGVPLIQRAGYLTRQLWRTPGICPGCGTAVAGVWA
ncbi:MAG: AmmeMemoRadiSam system radical SAM enzyme [Chloroflexi bacterium]|nr:MAG: AmmeMemoRadiSam system radical SAM enzyme [Chloroflexota bacterium]